MYQTAITKENYFKLFFHNCFSESGICNEFGKNKKEQEFYADCVKKKLNQVKHFK